MGSWVMLCVGEIRVKSFVEVEEEVLHHCASFEVFTARFVYCNGYIQYTRPPFLPIFGFCSNDILNSEDRVYFTSGRGVFNFDIQYAISNSFSV
jgi:hypothetical protein